MFKGIEEKIKSKYMRITIIITNMNTMEVNEFVKNQMVKTEEFITSKLVIV